MWHPVGSAPIVRATVIFIAIVIVIVITVAIVVTPRGNVATDTDEA